MAALPFRSVEVAPAPPHRQYPGRWNTDFGSVKLTVPGSFDSRRVPLYRLQRVERGDEPTAVSVGPGPDEADMTASEMATSTADQALLPPTAIDLSVVVQLVEAACRAREGDHAATTAHISRALRLLRRMRGTDPQGIVAPAGTPRLNPVAGLPSWKARRVLAHVEAHLSTKIAVEDLARLIGLSRSHFSNAFRRAVGVPPHTYILHRRIAVAQGLMLTTSDSLSAIALACGMYDQAHLTRYFRLIVGETPHAWRHARLSAVEIEAVIAHAG